MKRKIALIIWIHLTLILGALAQETRIRVIDDKDGKPVPFCHVCLEDKASASDGVVYTPNAGVTSICGGATYQSPILNPLTSPLFVARTAKGPADV